MDTTLLEFDFWFRVRVRVRAMVVRVRYIQVLLMSKSYIRNPSKASNGRLV